MVTVGVWHINRGCSTFQRVCLEDIRRRDDPEEMVFSFDEPKSAGLKLQEIMEKGDLVLIKGSRVVGLDKVVEEVCQM